MKYGQSGIVFETEVPPRDLSHLRVDLDDIDRRVGIFTQVRTGKRVARTADNERSLKRGFEVPDQMIVPAVFENQIIVVRERCGLNKVRVCRESTDLFAGGGVFCLEDLNAAIFRVNIVNAALRPE